MIENTNTLIILEEIDITCSVVMTMEFLYFSRIPLHKKIKGILEPEMILRTESGSGPYHMESYTKSVPWWQLNLHETTKRAQGEDDHYPITEEEAMTIIERWSKELPIEEAIANLKQKAEDSMKKG